jgi:hypothetical protein
MAWTASNKRGMAAALGLLVGVLAVACPVSAQAAPWRAFPPSSLWNVPAAQKGAITATNPFAGEFTSYSSTLEISGAAPDRQWGKPIFFAGPGDPEYRWTDQNGWAKGDIRYRGEPIPMPAGAHQSTGSDGHLTIVTADRRYEYDMWRANVSARTAETIVRFDLEGSGIPGDRDQNTSARGSGTPVIPTTIRAEEAVNGIDHALGLTVPSVAGDYLFPATHSDGDLGSGAVKYGMLFVLRPDFPVSAGANRGERNIIAALKTYGAYVVDQGASMGLDADWTHGDLWSAAGMYGDTSMPVRAGDWRLVDVDGASAAGPAKHRRRIVLRTARHSVWVGGKVRLRGRVRGAFPAGAHVRLFVHSHGRWHRLRRKPLGAGGTFATNPRLAHAAHASRHGGRRRLTLRSVRLRHGLKVLRIRAIVRGVGHSNVVRVRVRR